LFYEIKNAIKCWEEWKPAGLDLSKLNRLKTFISKHNLKRDEIIQHVNENKINIDTFKEIDDVIESEPHYFGHYNYQNLKKGLTR